MQWIEQKATKIEQRQCQLNESCGLLYGVYGWRRQKLNQADLDRKIDSIRALIGQDWPPVVHKKRNLEYDWLYWVIGRGEVVSQNYDITGTLRQHDLNPFNVMYQMQASWTDINPSTPTFDKGIPPTF